VHNAVESAAIYQALVKQAEEARLRVGITISLPKLYGPDNAVGALKPVLDALAQGGVYPR
jgi:hypothetical protein